MRCSAAPRFADGGSDVPVLPTARSPIVNVVAPEGDGGQWDLAPPNRRAGVGGADGRGAARAVTGQGPSLNTADSIERQRVDVPAKAQSETCTLDRAFSLATQLAAGGVPRTMVMFPEGAVIFSQGDAADSVMYIQKSCVGILRSTWSWRAPGRAAVSGEMKHWRSSSQALC